MYKIIVNIYHVNNELEKTVIQNLFDLIDKHPRKLKSEINE